MTDFFTLQRAGKLAENYRLLPGLLAELTGPELLRAGRLLARLDPAEVDPDVRTCTVAITGHGTLAPLVPPLTAEVARHGMLLRPVVGDFDGYLTDLADPASEFYATRADLTVCVLDPMLVFDEVPAPWRPADVRRVFDTKIETVRRLVATFEASSEGTLVLNTVPLPRRFSAQLIDHRSRAELGAVWREANARLLRLGEQHPAVVALDLDPLIAEGIPAEDDRFRTYAGMYLSPDLLVRYAREIGHLARVTVGAAKKCLVLDLDGTVWGGVLGEDGADGVEVSGTGRGGAFQEFQEVAKQLGSQGVLLAAVSKNDAGPVSEVLRGNPGMTLREEDFVRVTANWLPKHDNLTILAKDLNLGLDSFVFADDSPAECGLVRAELPAVTVLQLDEEPAGHVEKLVRDGWFDVLELSAEDGTRVAKYREELVRKDFLDSFESIEQYLRELRVRVTLAPADERDIPRVSQLTLRTNQFNLTTRRLQPARVGDLIEDPAWSVLTIRAGDRFGDNGLVGAIFTRREAAAVHIDNFVLSCRVFSRGIEQACLSALLSRARATGATEVFGRYRPSPKNGKVANLYPRYGFGELDAETFRHDLTGVVAVPDHIELAVTW
jgi:FkbH-like protein